MFKPILVGYDAGRGDRAPLEFGLAAASFTNARLIVASVHSGAAGAGRAGAGVIEEQLDEGWGDSLERLAEELRNEGVDADCRALPGTSAARALHEAAEELGAGLLVVGSTERGGIGRVLPGSTAHRLMHGAPCPIRSSHAPGSVAAGCTRSAWSTSTRPRATTRSTTRSRWRGGRERSCGC